jgi:predicted ribosome quality control (RQC) complex YloA/Tae2 family protein
VKVPLDLNSSSQENAAFHYEMAKKMREKAKGTEKAIEETKKELERFEAVIEKKPKIKMKRKTEWYEKFHWFVSSEGFLVIGGRDAEQNELLYSKYFEDADVFLHADIHGAPFVIVKNGSSAPEKTLEEAAQFAASYSSAWKEGMSAVSVYAAKKEQVSKHSQGAYVPKGGFVIKGDRKWFKNIELKMYIGVTESGIECIPARCGKERFISYFEIKPGGVGKGDLSKKLLQLLSEKLDNDKEISEEDINRALPPGKGELA